MCEDRHAYLVWNTLLSLDKSSLRVDLGGSVGRAYLQHVADLGPPYVVGAHPGVVLDGHGEAGLGLLVAVLLVVQEAKLAVDGGDAGADQPVGAVNLQGLVVVGQRKVELVQTEEAVCVGKTTAMIGPRYPALGSDDMSVKNQSK